MSEERVLTKKELESALFSAADALRSKMDANEYKNYLLGIIFYKYLSDKMLYHVGEVLEGRRDLSLEENQKIVTCMVIGYPSVKYQRTVPRNEAKVTWK